MSMWGSGFVHRYAALLNSAVNRWERGRSVKPVSGPVELVVHVTDSCSFACGMCMNARVPVSWPAEARHVPSPPFDAELFERLVRKWSSARAVCFAGVGEPLLNPDLREMVVLAHDLGIRTEVITNGTELVENVDWLTSGVVDAVSISVNAWDEESATKYCGVGHAQFDRVREGVSALVRGRAESGRPTEITASAVLWKGRSDDARHIVDLAAGWALDALFLHGLIPSSMAGFGPDAMLDRTDRVWMDGLVEYGADQGLRVVLPRIVRVGEATSVCSSPWRSLYVDAAGGVSGCMRVEAPSSSNGTWFDGSVWKSEYFVELRAAHLGHGQLPDRCRYCVESHETHP